MQNEKFNRLLGLAARAGKLAIGEGRASDCIRKKKAHLVIVSEDASLNTKKKFKNSCEFYSVTIAECEDRYMLGRCIGRDFAVVLAVEDINMANGLIDILKEDSSKSIHLAERGIL